MLSPYSTDILHTSVSIHTWAFSPPLGQKSASPSNMAPSILDSHPNRNNLSILTVEERLAKKDEAILLRKLQEEGIDELPRYDWLLEYPHI